MRRMSRQRRETGQVLVLFLLGLTALLAATALVIDGGNAMAQQRRVQNGVDAASLAGTVVIAQNLAQGSAPTLTGTCPITTQDAWDLAVCTAVYGTGTTDGVSIGSAFYTSWNGSPIGPVGNGLPTGAQGVQAFGSHAFGTYFARAIGIAQLTASAQSTAVTGIVTSICPPGSVCSLLPLTIPFVTSLCNSNGSLSPGTKDWLFLGNADMNANNEAIVPICKNQNNNIGGGSSGSVGWIDYSTAIGASNNGSCGNKILDQVTAPCVVSLQFPTWVQTFAGGVGQDGPAIETAINTQYHNQVVGIPLFDGTCKVQPSGTAQGDCPNGQIGVGVNTWYWIPSFVNFKLDYSYLAGNDRKSCNDIPGSPPTGGNGSDGCLKGWFTIALDSPGSIQLGSVTAGDGKLFGVQLIR